MTTSEALAMTGMRDFAIPLVLVFSLLFVYLLLIGKMNAWQVVWGITGVLCAGALFALVTHRSEDVTEVGAKTRWGDVLFKMEKVREDVFAKAEAVREIVEAAAELSAFSMVRVGRFASDDLLNLA